MVKFKPAAGFCGCFSLLAGTMVICGFHMFRTVTTLMVVDSVHPLKLGTNFELSPAFQTFYGAWNLAGVPTIILAGISALYGIDTHLKTYLYYAMITGVLDAALVLRYILSGSVCSTIIPKHVMRMGPAFVCTTTETMFIFWSLIFGIFMCYCYFILWSMATVTKRQRENLLRLNLNNDLPPADESQNEKKPLAPGVYMGYFGDNPYPISGAYGANAYQMQGQFGGYGGRPSSGYGPGGPPGGYAPMNNAYGGSAPQMQYGR